MIYVLARTMGIGRYTAIWGRSQAEVNQYLQSHLYYDHGGAPNQADMDALDKRLDALIADVRQVANVARN